MDNKLSELSKPVAWILHTRGGDVPTLDECYVANAEGMENIRSSALYSQEYASALLAELEEKDKRIDELETQVNVWESAAMKHLARAEEAEKRLPILEQDKLRLNEIINSEANRADAAEKLLATPVRLKKVDSSNVPFAGDGFNAAVDYCAKAVRAAGFTIEGDE